MPLPLYSDDALESREHPADVTSSTYLDSARINEASDGRGRFWRTDNPILPSEEFRPIGVLDGGDYYGQRSTRTSQYRRTNNLSHLGSANGVPSSANARYVDRHITDASSTGTRHVWSSDAVPAAKGQWVPSVRLAMRSGLPEVSDPGSTAADGESSDHATPAPCEAYSILDLFKQCYTADERPFPLVVVYHPRHPDPPARYTGRSDLTHDREEHSRLRVAVCCPEVQAVTVDPLNGKQTWTYHLPASQSVKLRNLTEFGDNVYNALKREEERGSSNADQSIWHSLAAHAQRLVSCGGCRSTSSAARSEAASNDETPTVDTVRRIASWSPHTLSTTLGHRERVPTSLLDTDDRGVDFLIPEARRAPFDQLGVVVLGDEQSPVKTLCFKHIFSDCSIMGYSRSNFDRIESAVSGRPSQPLAPELR